MVTSHSNILFEWLKTVTLTRKLGHLQSAEVHPHTPYTAFGCYLKGVQVRGRSYRLNVLESLNNLGWMEHPELKADLVRSDSLGIYPFQP